MERHIPAGDLRRAIFDEAFRALQSSRPVSVAVGATCRGAVFIVIPADRIARFGFQAFLDDKPGRQTDQVLAPFRRRKSSFNQILQGLPSAHRSRYSLRHGVRLLLAKSAPTDSARCSVHQQDAPHSKFPASLGLHLGQERCASGRPPGPNNRTISRARHVIARNKRHSRRSVG